MILMLALRWGAMVSEAANKELKPPPEIVDLMDQNTSSCCEEWRKIAIEKFILRTN
jgi:hypothetical protein